MKAFAVRPAADARAGYIPDHGRSLEEALGDPACYPHPASPVEMLETHISWVFLAGEYAYKVKKPVRLPFLDFTTLEARRRFCEEEVRLNRRSAPELYLDVAGIGGTPQQPRIDAAPAFEYAVRMRRFPQEAILEHQALRNALQPATVDALADRVADMHAAAPRADARSGFGGAAAVSAPALANFEEIAALDPPQASLASLDALHAWTGAQLRALAPQFDTRKAQGFVRECHGDLHLGNVVEIDGQPLPFDCIEFGEAFRWIDVMDEVAFTTMDLIAHGLERLAFRYLDRYLERSGDYSGLPVLRFFLVYRAMVRAKIAWIRHVQSARAGDAFDFERYLALARHLAERAAPVLMVMHGLSGSGKTTASQRLLEALGAIRVRSDVERKRLHGLPARARSASPLGGGLYGRAESQQAYRRMADVAREALAAGFPVVADAAFLRREDRAAFAALAREAGAACEFVCCTAPEGVLRERLAERERAGADASEAGLAVLEAQLASQEPLTGAERIHATLLDTTSIGEWKGAVESVARRFRVRWGGS